MPRLSGWDGKACAYAEYGERREKRSSLRFFPYLAFWRSASLSISFSYLCPKSQVASVSSGVRLDGRLAFSLEREGKIPRGRANCSHLRILRIGTGLFRPTPLKRGIDFHNGTDAQRVSVLCKNAPDLCRRYRKQRSGARRYNAKYFLVKRRKTRKNRGVCVW